jgi:hypothetical protein
MEVVGEADEDCQMGLREVQKQRLLLPSQRLREAAAQGASSAAALPVQASPSPLPSTIPADNLASWPTVDMSNVDRDYARSLR